MILTGEKILEEINNKNILIEPFRDECLGMNSYDLHLGRHMATYKTRVLDSKEHNKIEEILLNDSGYIIEPNVLYLGVSEEYTEILHHVPFLEGISSASRLGIFVNCSSGKGNIGHCNTWTIEITSIQPVRIYPGMPIAKLMFFTVEGKATTKYNKSKKSKYTPRTIKPIESMMWKNKF